MEHQPLEKKQKSSAAANSPHYKLEGVRSAKPPPLNLSSEPVSDEKINSGQRKAVKPFNPSDYGHNMQAPVQRKVEPFQLKNNGYSGKANPFSTIQKKDGDEDNSISIQEAKEIIRDATSGPGTNESAIYDAIRRCNNNKGLLHEADVMNALSGDMQGHGLWKCYLLMEYGDEANFPTAINKLWSATVIMGTKEKAVFEALESMDESTKMTYGLKYILQSELSGNALQKALDLITTSDSISGNLYGSPNDGNEELIVDRDKLRPLIDSRFTGASSSGLREAMEVLYGNPDGAALYDVLASVETIRGLAPGSALAQYQKAMTKQAAGISYYQKHMEESGRVYDHEVDNPSPALDTNKHEDFTGSSAQLRFGKIVGDVFGIDAVFGSLVSPTGGMAGPGNDRIKFIEDGSAVATHGAIHDAAGYLYNCHGIGPGYDYLKSEPASQPGNPLAGQTNISWWIDEYNKTGNDVGMVEKTLESNAHIGAAFSKDYGELNLDQKKDALKVLSETSIAILWFADISNTDRVSKITELMDSASAEEKTALADYFYTNNGFNTFWRVYPIMKPHVSEEVYNNYLLKRTQH